MLSIGYGVDVGYGVEVGYGVDNSPTSSDVVCLHPDRVSSMKKVITIYLRLLLIVKV